ncbi:MAG: hypothetical protein JWN44_3737 [Myxococcales bacterium]|nr:hypothetical protein [Myxococcales bacterium]
MKRIAGLLMMAAVTIGALAGCPGGSSDLNPAQIWLGPMGDELHVQLLAVEPHPY